MDDQIFQSVKLSFLVWRKRWATVSILMVQGSEHSLLLRSEVDHARVPLVDWDTVLQEIEQAIQITYLVNTHELIVVSLVGQPPQFSDLIGRQIDESRMLRIKGLRLHNVYLLLFFKLSLIEARCNA